MWYVYIVKCNDGSFYTGVTNNIDGRLKRHNTGRGAKYTRRKRPVTLVYAEKFPNRSAAQSREAEVKSYSREGKQKLIAGVAQW
ncbi:MAG: GIY-YIG nuclease family protein [Candidatus Omnitrophica bacterium]|nr:GIY-YIG nuclease family protein [Candidatus Omnitrophota bacterium]